MRGPEQLPLLLCPSAYPDNMRFHVYMTRHFFCFIIFIFKSRLNSSRVALWKLYNTLINILAVVLPIAFLLFFNFIGHEGPSLLHTVSSESSLLFAISSELSTPSIRKFWFSSTIRLLFGRPGYLLPFNFQFSASVIVSLDLHTCLSHLIFFFF